jgi:hypothetical protein
MLWGETRGYDRPLIAIYKKKGYLPRVAFSHANALSIWPPAKLSMMTNKYTKMIQIEIHKISGESYRAAVPSLNAVVNLAEICDITKIFIFAITPREFNYLRSLDLPSKIEIIR